MHVVDSVEASVDDSVLLLCGNNLLVATSFDGHFDYINKLMFDDNVTRVKRLSFSDVYLVGGWACLYFVQFSPKSMTKLSSMPNIVAGMIQWIEVDRNNIYLFEESGTEARRISYKSDIDSYKSTL